jgi:membrane protein DedA with SNARE-associated domain
MTQMLASVALSSAWWEYVLLFLAVAASWAGVPFVGATALGAAGVAASQGHLNLALVVAVATVAGEVGGLAGYGIGNRWGRVLLERPGRHQAGRQRMVERGERAYAKWGRLAVFFTPAIVSGTARMDIGEFAFWNFLASLGFALSVGASAFGLGRILTGHYSPHDIATLIVGLSVGAAIMVLFVHRRRRRRASSDEASAR